MVIVVVVGGVVVINCHTTLPQLYGISKHSVKFVPPLIFRIGTSQHGANQGNGLGPWLCAHQTVRQSRGKFIRQSREIDLRCG